MRQMGAETQLETRSRLSAASRRQRRPRRTDASGRVRQRQSHAQTARHDVDSGGCSDAREQEAARIAEAQLGEGKGVAVAAGRTAAGDAAGALRGDGERRVGEGGAHEFGAGENAE